MSMMSTFGSFTTARLGIYAAQKGLQVTGNNISNINTPGYTRQVLDQISLSTNGSERYHSQYSAKVGSGALVVSISQMRDPYLDIRYRTEMARVGAMDAKLGGLNDIAAIIDEVGKGEDEHGILEAQLSDFTKTLRNLSDKTGQDEFDTQVRTSAAALARLFNSYSDQLDKLERNTATRLKQDIDTVNGILENIRDLNDAIRKSDIHGDNALEQRDDRNRLLDELSQYMKISATYSMETIAPGVQVEKLTVTLDGDSVDPTDSSNSLLIDGTYATKLSIRELAVMGADGKPVIDQATGKPKTEPDPLYRIDLAALQDRHGDVLKVKQPDGKYKDSEKVALEDTDLFGALQSVRELLTEQGEFSQNDDLKIDPKAGTKRGIPYYRKALDLLARQFADTMNKANNGYLVNEKGEYLKEGADGKYEVILGNDGKPLTAAAGPTEEYLKNKGAIHRGGNLFSNSGNSNDGTGITAGNISVAKDWATSDLRIVNSFVIPTGMDATATTDSTNITHMVTLMETKQDYKGNLGAPDVIFHGTFQEMLSKIATTLGDDQRGTGILLDTYYVSSVDLDTSRDSVSSVDLNDEATNLIQYQKAYSAACRLLTTLDEALEKLINGTGIVGR